MSRIPYADRSYLLTYSTNVHPGETIEDLLVILERDVAAVKRRAFPDEAMGLNLRLGMAQIDALAHPRARARVAEALERGGYFLFTVNGFPLRDFHAPRVKESVYTPSWAEPARADYTIGIARALHALMPPAERVGSISSLTGRFQPEESRRGDHATPGTSDSGPWTGVSALRLAPELLSTMAREVGRVVVALARLTDEGREIVLGLEPEPFTTAETTAAFIDYFQEHLLPAGIEALLEAGYPSGRAEALCRTHLGIQLDLCHQAVEFEDIVSSVEALAGAGIRMAGVHVSSALRVDRPRENPEGLAALRAYDEPRYLHQCIGTDAEGRVILRAVDLDRLGEIPAAVETLKCHFHVPLFQPTDGPLGTTAGEIAAPLRRILERDLTRHVSLETYTWNLLTARHDRATLASLESGAQRRPEGRVTTRKAGTRSRDFGLRTQDSGLRISAGVESVHEGIAREFEWYKEHMMSPA